jgi:hypothetical protein
MSFIWDYFTLSGRVAFCKENNCDYQKDFPPQAPTTNLISHLKTTHKQKHKEYLEKKSSKDKKQQPQPSIKE